MANLELDPIRHSFAGQRAATADRFALAAAKARLDAGEGAEVVRQDTGWHQGIDGRWRFEISDADARLTNLRMDESGVAWRASNLGELLDHPALYAAYPGLKSLDVEIDVDPAKEVKGAFIFAVPGDDTTFGASEQIRLTAPTAFEALRTLLHELQHKIQTDERFAPGGGMRAADVDLPLAAVRKIDALHEAAMGHSLKGEFDSARSLRDEAQRLRRSEAFQQYRRLAGEVEARNTETRHQMSDGERRATAPGATADTPDALLIVKEAELDMPQGSVSKVVVQFNGVDAPAAPAPANAAARPRSAISDVGRVRAAVSQVLGAETADKLIGAKGGVHVVTADQLPFMAAGPLLEMGSVDLDKMGGGLAKGAAELFFNALAQEIESSGPASATEREWAAYLDGLPGRGFRADELDWTGIRYWIASRGAAVTREDVLGFVDARGVQALDVSLVAASPQSVALSRLTPEQLAGVSVQAGAGAATMGWSAERDGESGAQILYSVAEGVDQPYGVHVDGLALDSYETLEAAADALVGRDDLAHALAGASRGYREVALLNPGARPSFVQWAQNEGYTAAGAKALEPGLRERYRAALDARRAQEADPGTWQAKDLLAHVRLSDKQDANGAKVLFVQEIRSEWAGSTGQIGFRGGAAAQVLALEKTVRELLAESGYASIGPALKAAASGDASAAVLRDEVKLLNQQMAGLVLRQGGKPALAPPLAGQSPEWRALVLKRLISLALEGGYNSVAFADATALGERYDMTAPLNAFDAFEVTKRSDGRLDVLGRSSPDMGQVLAQGLAPERLPALTASREKANSSGEAALRAFYDEALPGTLAQVLRGSRGSDLVEVALVDGPKGDPTTQMGFYVTPAMRGEASGSVLLASRRESAQAQGFDARVPWFPVQAGGLGRGIYFTPNERAAWEQADAAPVPVLLKRGEVFDRANGVDYLALARRIKAHNPLPALAYREGTFSDPLQPWLSLMLAHDDALALHLRDGEEEINVWLARAGYIGVKNSRAAQPEVVALFDSKSIRSPWAGTAPSSDALLQGRAAQARTPEFRAWFGSSKVASGGAPLVVYHGTTRDFSSFDIGRRGDKTGGADAKAGFFFAENPDAADQFTWEAGEKTGHIMPVYLSLQNPLYSPLVLDGTNSLKAASVIEQARASGHDGVVFEQSDMLGRRGRCFAAFEPEQIKSAIGNSGAFSRLNQDVLHSVALAPLVDAGIWRAAVGACDESLEDILQEHLAAIERSLAEIGDTGECAILRHQSQQRWTMVLRDASHPGKWRTQDFDATGFFGHSTFDTKALALTRAVEGSYTVRDDTALDRLQDAASFQRGLFAADMRRQVFDGEINTTEMFRKLAQYDVAREVLDGLAAESSTTQGFYSRSADSIVLIADRIGEGEERAVYLHETMHRWGRRVIGQDGMERLASQVRRWQSAPAASVEARIYRSATDRATRHADMSVRDEELIAYAVEEAVKSGVQPSLEADQETAENWLGDVAATIEGFVFQVTQGAVVELGPKDLVNLAYALAQMERPEVRGAVEQRLDAQALAALARLADAIARPADQTQSEGFKRWARGCIVVKLRQDHVYRTGEGVVVEALHGTTAAFDNFSIARSQQISDLGRGIYATNTADDVNENYAGFGPDLTSKIDNLVEEILCSDDGCLDEEIDPEQARLLAHRRLGVAHEGQVMPLYIRMECPAVIGGPGETLFTMEVDDDCVESGTLRAFIDAFETAYYNKVDISAFTRGEMDALAASWAQAAEDTCGIGLQELLDMAKSRLELHGDGDEGCPQDMLREALETLGFDGVIDTTVAQKFCTVYGGRVLSRMQGMDRQTAHFVAFSADQVASRLGSTWTRDALPGDLLKSERAQCAPPSPCR